MSAENLSTNPAGTTHVRPAAATATSASILSMETMSLALVMSVALVTHAFNMFNYPLYRQDEGIVSQNAYSFMQNWQLSPYTFNYEHPPMATFMLSLWTLLTGGFHTFGPAINSGRVLMLVLHLASTFFLYRIARQLAGGSNSAAVVAGLLFSLSPLAVTFQRLIVVDNFMMFWLLATLFLTICSRERLFSFFTASMTLGLAIMSGETAIFFLPAFLVLMWRFSDHFHRLYAFWGALVISLVVTFQFILYALFKSELFPDNFDFMGEIEGRATHVSMFGTYFQNYRDSVPAWQGSEAFNFLWNLWSGLDIVLLLVGGGCAVLNLLFGFKRKENWVVPIMLATYGLFLGLGGIDADYAIVVFVPFLALAIGQTVGGLCSMLGSTFSFVATVAIAVVAGYFYITANQGIYTKDVNTTYQQVVSWIKGNLPTDRSIVTTDAIWVDLRSNYKGPAYPLAHSHWKAANDPAVRVNVFAGNYKNVDYLVMTQEMRKQFESRNLVFNQQALQDSSLVREFDNPDAIEIRKVNNSKPLMEASILKDAYSSYKTRFIAADGKVTDATGHSSADLQASTMMLSIWNNDQKTFDKLWFWAAHNLQLENSLFRADPAAAAGFSRSNLNTYTNTRADIDVALALVLAERRWKDPNYLNEARYIMKSVWDNAVITVNKRLYIKATVATTGQLEDQVLLNLGAFSPHAFRLFAGVDPERNWEALTNDGYALLRKAAWYGRGDYKGVGLPPGLAILSLETEELRSTERDFGTRLDNFDQEAQQALWRVALDYRWHGSNSTQARDYIESTGWFLVKQWQKDQLLTGEYTSNGFPVEGSLNLSSYAVGSAYAGILDEIEIAKKLGRGEQANLGGSSVETEIMARVFMGEYFRKEAQAYWLRPDEIDMQQWGWMATALHLNRLNLSFEERTTRPELARNR